MSLWASLSHVIECLPLVTKIMLQSGLKKKKRKKKKTISILVISKNIVNITASAT